MGTKSTNKKQPSKKNIDKIAEGVTKRGVYIVKKTDSGYNVVNCMNNASTPFVNVPDRDVAERVCERYNAARGVSRDLKLRYFNKMREYEKHKADCEFYEYAMNTAKDMFKVEIAEMRKDLSEAYMAKIKREILGMI